LPVIVTMAKKTGRMEVVRDARVRIKSGERYFVNVGSIGQPRDSNPDACCLLLDEEAASMEFVRIPYDISKSQGKILSNGLPSYLAERLMLAR
jgi:diadenosine tetraphosphatase ApaH/serine/threonine PP2A family protein phosphatase